VYIVYIYEGVVVSRGLGKFQRNVFEIIRAHGKPMTFAEILGIDEGPFLPSVIRSVRRAVHKLVKDGTLITVGGGGRGDPYRYFFDPIGMAMFWDRAEYDALMAGLEADPGRPNIKEPSAEQRAEMLRALAELSAGEASAAAEKPASGGTTVHGASE
jgi:hypothetical protein